MSYKFPIHKRNSYGNYGPTSQKHFYSPVSYHNKNARQRKGKTRWIISEGEQYEVFKIGDEGKWNCSFYDCIFSVLDNCNEVIGENGERIGFFKNPINVLDPYHGFPVFSSIYTPSINLLENWEKKGVINIRIRIKIEKGQL